MKTVTDELNELIALHGNARDALNVTLAKLRVALDRIAVLEEVVQQKAEPKCPECGSELEYWSCKREKCGCHV